MVEKLMCRAMPDRQTLETPFRAANDNYSSGHCSFVVSCSSDESVVWDVDVEWALRVLAAVETIAVPAVPAVPYMFAVFVKETVAMVVVVVIDEQCIHNYHMPCVRTLNDCIVDNALPKTCF